jgi:hypothetical protein
MDLGYDATACQNILAGRVQEVVVDARGDGRKYDPAGAETCVELAGEYATACTPSASQEAELAIACRTALGNDVRASEVYGEAEDHSAANERICTGARPDPGETLDCIEGATIVCPCPDGSPGASFCQGGSFGPCSCLGNGGAGGRVAPSAGGAFPGGSAGAPAGGAGAAPGFSCGDGVVGPGESCDGTSFAGETCASATMNARPQGTLLCTAYCSFDLSACFGGSPAADAGVSCAGVLTRAEALAEPCEFALPVAPAGETLDVDLINVLVQPVGAQSSVVPHVSGTASCAADGWYYDDPVAPSKIIFCPTSCAALSEGGTRVDLRLGCATVVGP